MEGYFCAARRSCPSSLTWEAGKKKNWRQYSESGLYRITNVLFCHLLNAVQRFYRACRCRILKAKTQFWPLSSRSPNPDKKIRQAHQALFLVFSQPCYQRTSSKDVSNSDFRSEVRVSITAQHLCLWLLVKLLLSHDFVLHVHWHPNDLLVQRQLMHS